jgi:uncharacterized membrane protein YagU involved in acid resistance
MKTSGRSLPFRTRLIFGGIAGFVATAAMTSAMARLHRRLPHAERYPLPPREITETVLGPQPDGLVRDEAMLAHFAYGAATGALVAAARPTASLGAGAAAGVAIWAGSYFGWAPALGILKPANEHPARRNALMIGVHLVWGAATALTLRELFLARRTILNDGPLRDRA